MICKNRKQILKLGLLVLLVFGSFLIFKKVSYACLVEKNIACVGGDHYDCGFIKDWPDNWVCGIKHTPANYYCSNETSGGPLVDECSNADVWLKKDACPSTNSYNGEECEVADGSSQLLFGIRCHSQSGRWNAEDNACVQCEPGKPTRAKLLAEGSTRCINLTDGNWEDYACANDFAGKCDYGCGADLECNHFDDAPGIVVPGGTCNNCVFAGGPLPNCGNGSIDAGEECDGNNLGGKTCVDLGFTGGNLACFPPGSPNQCKFDTSGCSGGACGGAPKGMRTYEADGKTVAYDGLVPCGRCLHVDCNPQYVPCELCHLFVMLDGIMDFLLFKIVPPLVILLFVAGGGLYILGAGLLGTTGKPETVKTAKELITAVIIGLLIIFIAWILVNTFFMFIGTASWTGLKGGWFKINCPIKLPETPIPCS